MEFQQLRVARRGETGKKTATSTTYSLPDIESWRAHRTPMTRMAGKFGVILIAIGCAQEREPALAPLKLLARSKAPAKMPAIIHKRQLTE